MNKTHEKNITLGVLCGVGAFLIWGFAPMYWKQINHISSLELLGHRIVWGCLTLVLLLIAVKGKKIFQELIELGDKKLLLSSFLIFANWFLFVWAVNNDHIVDASLGYYLTPLINVLTGYFFFEEKMRPMKIQAILLATFGVGLLFILKSGAPWVSLLLACTFSFYGYLKKKSSLSAQSALLFEMLVWVAPVIIYFIYLFSMERLSFIQVEGSVSFYIFLAGIVTITPLWLFNTSVKHLDLGTVGFLQYLAPSIQLGVGVLLYKEEFSYERFLSFALIWVGILLYSVDSYFNKRKNESRIS